jgi:hypothetical protein
LFNAVFFPTSDDLLPHFFKLYQSDHYWNTILKNLDVYTYEFNSLFHYDLKKYAFAIQYSSAFMLVLFVIGFVNMLLLPYKFELTLLVVYSFTVLLFPYSNQGFRYLLPVLPIIMLCIVVGAKSIATKGHNKYLLGTCFVVFILLQYKREIRNAHAHRLEAFWPGPQTAPNQRMFVYIQTNISDTAVIACLKPRAIQLFTGKKSCALPYDSTIAGIESKMYQSKGTHLLHIKDQGERVIEDLAVYEKDSLIWESDACKIYQRKSR